MSLMKPETRQRRNEQLAHLLHQLRKLDTQAEIADKAAHIAESLDSLRGRRLLALATDHLIQADALIRQAQVAQEAEGEPGPDND